MGIKIYTHSVRRAAYIDLFSCSRTCNNALAGKQSGRSFTFRIFLESLKSGTVCMPVPSTSQTSAKAMDHKPASPEAISDPPKKRVGVTAQHQIVGDGIAVTDGRC